MPGLLTAGHEHLIITRFSVKFFADSDPFPRQWLEDRLRLFEAYCLPGIAAQTCGDFSWILLCDETTEASCVEELDGLASAVPDSAVVMTSPDRSSLPAIVEQLGPAADVLITTRVDSDDAVAVDFVERIQTHVAPFRRSPHEALLLSFSQGRSIETQSGALYDSFQPHGPFLSLFERVSSESEPSTVYSGNHGHLHLRYPLQMDASRSAWLQVLHGQNVNNHVRAIDLRIPDDSVGDQFVLRPAAAGSLSGVPAPHADRIRAVGERGIEGVHEIQPLSASSGTRV